MAKFAANALTSGKLKEGNIRDTAFARIGSKYIDAVSANAAKDDKILTRFQSGKSSVDQTIAGRALQIRTSRSGLQP